MKFVINRCYGGFGLSNEARKALGMTENEWDSEIRRDDPELIKVVEEMGEDAEGSSADLEIVEIPDDATDWEVDEYDGLERIIYVEDGKLHYAYH